MNLKDLFELQKIMETNVKENLASDYSFDSSYALTDKEIAYQCEVYELINELGFFKYWKHSKKQNRLRILDEAADVMHMLLSIGLHKGYERLPLKTPEAMEFALDYPYSELFKMWLDAGTENVGRWELSWKLFLSMMWKAGFEWEALVEAYEVKHKTNILRQKEGY